MLIAKRTNLQLTYWIFSLRVAVIIVVLYLKLKKNLYSKCDWISKQINFKLIINLFIRYKNMVFRIHLFYIIYQASHSAGALVLDCKRDWLWVRSPLEGMKYLFNLYFHFLALVSRQNAALNSITVPLPTLLCAGYSVKLIFKILSYTKFRLNHHYYLIIIGNSH